MAVPATTTPSMTASERQTVDQFVSGTHPTIKLRNTGAAPQDFATYQNAFADIAEKSPTFRKMLEVIEADGKPLTIDINQRLQGKALGRATLEMSSDGTQRRSVVYSGMRAREPEQMLFAIPNEFAHVMQMIAQTMGKGRGRDAPEALVELESDLLSYQVMLEVTGEKHPEVLGNHGWPKTFDGYDFRVARAVGIDVPSVIGAGLKADGLNQNALNTLSERTSDNPLSTNGKFQAVLQPSGKKVLGSDVAAPSRERTTTQNMNLVNEMNTFGVGNRDHAADPAVCPQSSLPEWMVA